MIKLLKSMPGFHEQNDIYCSKCSLHYFDGDDSDKKLSPATSRLIKNIMKAELVLRKVVT